MVENKYKPRAIAFFILAVIGSILFGLGIVRVADDYDDIWLLFIGIFLSVPMWVFGFVALWQASKVGKLLRGEGVLAVWSLSTEEKEAHAAALWEKAKKDMVSWMIAGGILILFAFLLGFVVFLFDPITLDEMPWLIIILCLLGVMVLVFSLGVLSPWLERRQIRGGSRDIVIGPHSAVLPGGKHAIWHGHGAGAHAKSVDLTCDQFGDALVIHYESMSGGKYHRYIEEGCRISIPGGKKAEAAAVGKEIAKACGVEFIWS